MIESDDFIAAVQKLFYSYFLTRASIYLSQVIKSICQRSLYLFANKLLKAAIGQKSNGILRPDTIVALKKSNVFVL